MEFLNILHRSIHCSYCRSDLHIFHELQDGWMDHNHCNHSKQSPSWNSLLKLVLCRTWGNSLNDQSYLHHNLGNRLGMLFFKYNLFFIFSLLAREIEGIKFVLTLTKGCCRNWRACCSNSCIWNGRCFDDIASAGIESKQSIGSPSWSSINITG